MVDREITNCGNNLDIIVRDVAVVCAGDYLAKEIGFKYIPVNRQQSWNNVVTRFPNFSSEITGLKTALGRSDFIKRSLNKRGVKPSYNQPFDPVRSFLSRQILTDLAISKSSILGLDPSNENTSKVAEDLFQSLNLKTEKDRKSLSHKKIIKAVLTGDLPVD